MSVSFSHAVLDSMMARAKELVYSECREIFFVTRNFKVVYVTTLEYPAALSKQVGKGEFLMLFNPDKLTRDAPLFTHRELAIVIFHEMWHLVLGHLQWFEAKQWAYDKYIEECKRMGVKPEIEGVVHRIFNQAADYIINDSIPALGDNVQYYLDGKGGKIFSNLCLVPKIENIPGVKSWLDSGKRVREMNLEDLYEILLKEAKEKNDGKEKGKPGSGQDDGSTNENEPQTMDGHAPKMSEEDAKELGEMCSPDKDDVEKMVNDAIRDATDPSMNRGGDSSGLTKFISEYKKIKGDAALVREIQKFYRSAASDRTVDSYAIRNRKYGYKSAGQEVEQESFAGVIWDDSGSCFTEAFIEKALGCINMIKKYCDDTIVVVGDTELKQIYRLKGKQVKAGDFKLIGGGGSNMNFGPLALKKYRPDFQVVITDGAIEPFDSLGIKTIFIIPRGGKIVPGYKCFFLD